MISYPPEGENSRRIVLAAQNEIGEIPGILQMGLALPGGMCKRRSFVSP